MPIDPVLIAQSHQLLNRARLMAEAPAAQTGEIGHGHPSGSAPPGAWTFQSSTLATFGARINQAIATGSNIELLSANSWCASELEQLQHSPSRGAETPAEFRYRICNDYEGVLAGIVARREMTSVTTVRKFRTEDGRDARTGYKLKAVAQ